MKQLILLLISLSIIPVVNGQLAMVKDRDGYTNIRNAASLQGKITDTISSGRIVFCFEKEGEWYSIDYNRRKKELNGFIHRSRIQFLDSFSKLTPDYKNDSLLMLRNESTTITITTGAFDKNDRNLKFEKDDNNNEILASINNQKIWGTDGEIPKGKYKSIKIMARDLPINMPDQSFIDLFEPNLNMTEAVVDPLSGTIYLSASNSDGAGAYVVVWCVRQNGIYREIFYGF